MKSIVMPVSDQLKEETQQQLSEKVNETVVKKAITKTRKNKTFTPSEMWRLRRQMRSASGMMNRWSMN